MLGLRKVRASDLQVGDEIRPFGVITKIEDGARHRYIHFNLKSKAREFPIRSKWWVEDKPDKGNEREKNMVSHRRRPDDTNPQPHAQPTEYPTEHYAQQYEDARQASEKALNDARLIANNPDQSTLFLHEATVHAQLAQAAAGMATAAATRGAGVEIRAVTE